MTEEEKAVKEAEETKKNNYERLLLAIAVLYANQIGVDIKKQDDYSKLTSSQKTFADKIYKSNPLLQAQVESSQRITEEQIVQDVSEVAQTHSQSTVLRIVTVGDDRVCDMCAKWQGKEVSLDGSSHPSLQDAIDDGFLHYNCRCSLQELSTKEIKLNPLNPRYEARAAANPAVYHSSADTRRLVFL